MGLKHNPRNAYKPSPGADWTLIIHKVKDSHYIEGDSQASILSMARTLLCGYMSENAGSQCVVLVKDGVGAQKPAVREIRLNRVL